jgi:hypothetical protein
MGQGQDLQSAFLAARMGKTYQLHPPEGCTRNKNSVPSVGSSHAGWAGTVAILCLDY